MTDVRGIFDELLTGPVPPMASSEVMLATARQAERRRRRGVLAAGASGLAVFALAVPVGIGAAGNGPAPDPGQGVAGTPTPGFPAGGVRTSADLLDALAATLPVGLTVRRDPAGDDVRFSEVPDVDAIRPGMGLKGVRVLDAAAVVYLGDRAGEIAVSLVDGRAAADPLRRSRQPRPDDLCPARTPSPSVKAGAEPDQGVPCRTVPVAGAGLPVRILGPQSPHAGLDGGAARPGGGSGPDDDRSGADAEPPNPPGTDCVTATRYAPGVEVELRWCPAVSSLPLAEPAEPVSAAVLGAERLAEIAAAPALLPAPVEGGR